MPSSPPLFSLTLKRLVLSPQGSIIFYTTDYHSISHTAAILWSLVSGPPDFNYTKMGMLWYSPLWFQHLAQMRNLKSVCKMNEPLNE